MCIRDRENRTPAKGLQSPCATIITNPPKKYNMDALLLGRLGLRFPCCSYRGAVIEALYTINGGGGWIRTTALFRGQIYSLVQSTTLPRLHIWWTDGESNPDPRLAKPLCSRYHYQPKFWRPGRDSNPHERFWRPSCCHYTTRTILTHCFQCVY